MMAPCLPVPFRNMDATPERPGEAGTNSALLRRLGVLSATALVVSSMVGTGIFTTSGLLAGDLGDPGLILVVWIVGGLCALAGALCYAELGVNFPSSGGEYEYLSRAYGPTWEFIRPGPLGSRRHYRLAPHPGGSANLTGQNRGTAYVSYEAADPFSGIADVDTPAYAIGYRGRWRLTDLSVKPGPDLLDRVKGRAFGLTSGETEEAWEGTSDWRRTLNLRVQPMSHIWYYYDFLSPASPGRFHSSTLAAGLALDGPNDTAGTDVIPGWSQSLPGGTLVMVSKELTPFPLPPSGTACLPNAGPPLTGGTTTFLTTAPGPPGCRAKVDVRPPAALRPLATRHPPAGAACSTSATPRSNTQMRQAFPRTVGSAPGVAQDVPEDRLHLLTLDRMNEIIEDGLLAGAALELQRIMIADDNHRKIVPDRVNRADHIEMAKRVVADPEKHRGGPTGCRLMRDFNEAVDRVKDGTLRAGRFPEYRDILRVAGEDEYLVT